MTSYYGVYGKVAPPGSTVVSWLPFYHDMGFVLGLILPILAGIPAVLTSPIGFLQRPARWIQMLASNTLAFTAAPNFAFDLASRKTKDEDMEGLDLGGVHGILNGSERVQPVTLKRFIDRFAPFNLDPKAIRPSYGMAEATGRRARGTRGVLQVQDIRMAVSGRTRTGARPSIKIQPIDFDHRRCVLAGLRLDVFDDIVDDRGRRENDRRCGIGEHGNGALVVGTTLGNRKRNRDNSGLQRGNKANDIVEDLWRQN